MERFIGNVGDIEFVVTDCEDVIVDVLKDRVGVNTIWSGGVGKASAVVEVAFTMSEVASRCGVILRSLPVSTSNRSTPNFCALAFICLVNDTKSPQSAP